MAPSGRFGLGITNCRPSREVVDGIRRAEAQGAEIAFIAEDVNCRDAFLLGGLAARETATIRLATGVVNPYTRNPTSLAMAAATLDEVTGGRAVLGLGTSSPSLITDQMGILTGSPTGVMREATAIIRALLAGETVTAPGQRFSYVDAHLEVRPVQPRLPIYFAAMGPQMLRLAGGIADGVLLNVGATTQYVRWAVGEIRRGAAQAGRDAEEITVAAWHTVYVTDDYPAALARAREWLATMLSIPRQGELLIERGGGDPAVLPAIRAHVSGYPHRGDPATAGAAIPEDMVERMTLIGSPERVRERIEEYREAGVDIPVLGLPAIRRLEPGM